MWLYVLGTLSGADSALRSASRATAALPCGALACYAKLKNSMTGTHQNFTLASRSLTTQDSVVALDLRIRGGVHLESQMGERWMKVYLTALRA